MVGSPVKWRPSTKQATRRPNTSSDMRASNNSSHANVNSTISMSLEQKIIDGENISEALWANDEISLSREHAINKDFDRITQGSWANDADYDSVNALLLQWVDDDMKVKDEVLKFKELLEADLRFKTTTYCIPSENAAAELNYQLASFMRLHSLQRRTLTIIYYAGHADDVDEASPAGYSEWRA